MKQCECRRGDKQAMHSRQAGMLVLYYSPPIPSSFSSVACLGTWSKNNWTDSKKSLVFLKSNFFVSEKFQVSAHVLQK
jgi:hypothetical protein